MIYQCYYLPEHEPFLLQDPLYVGVCLQPERLPKTLEFDVRNTKPLADLAMRQQLCEYAAMLAVWRQRPHSDPWVGFTSWRQFHKGFSFRFDEAALGRILAGEVLCWGRRTLDETLHHHAERCHPGLTGVLEVLLREVHGCRLPDRYFIDRTGPFCNYWAMSWGSFDRYMNWSWPLLESAIERWDLNPPFNLFPRNGTQDRSYAFLLERLFIVQCLNTEEERIVSMSSL